MGGDIMNGSIKLSGEYSFVCDRVEISLVIDGVTINSVYRYVTQEGIASSLLESSDHPIIALFTESNKDRMVSEADEDFFERYIDAVETLDGQAGPTIDQARSFPARFEIAIPDHQICHLLNVLADVRYDLENETHDDYDIGPKSTLHQVQILSDQIDVLFSRHLSP